MIKPGSLKQAIFAALFQKTFIRFSFLIAITVFFIVYLKQIHPLHAATIWGLATLGGFLFNILRKKPLPNKIKEHPLHRKFISFFTSLIVIPLVFIAIFALCILYFGLSTWFDQRVQTAISESQNIAEAYFKETQEVVRQNLEMLARDLQDIPSHTLLQSDFLSSFLTLQASVRAFNRVVLTDGSGNALGRSLFAGDLENEFHPNDYTDNPSVFLNASKDHILGTIKPIPNNQLFLLISKRVEPKILARITQTKIAATTYQELLNNRWQIIFQFIGFFVFITTIVLLIAIKRAIKFSRQISLPIATLTKTAEKIQQGDFSFLNQPHIPQTSNNIKEFKWLSSTFYQMAKDIRNAQKKLYQAHKELSHKHNFNKEVLANISSGVLAIKKEGQIIFSNTKAQEILALGKKDINKKNLETISPKLFDCFRQGASIKEYQVKTPIHNQLATLKIKVTKGKDDLTFLTFDNISSILLMQEQAAWAHVAKRVTHEIKNPLTPIQLSAQRLKKLAAREKLGETLQKSINVIDRQAQHLAHMLSSFLEFAKMPPPQFRTINLKKIIEDSFALQKQAYPAIQWHFQLAEDIDVSCDPGQIQQVLMNLIKNAVESIEERYKKNLQKGQITIISTKKDNFALCTLEDNGMGLLEAKDPSAPNLYVSNKPKGNNLGIPIVKKIILDHKGQFFLRNKSDGGGAQASFTLPLTHDLLST